MSPDAAVAHLAAGRAGAVTRAELEAAGLGPKAIARRVADGRLRRIHRGVYLAGAVDAPFSREWAALLACGPSAVLSHHSAGALWRVLARPAAAVHVTVAGHRRQQPGVTVHRARLARGEVRRRHGLPVTAPHRTLLDLAAVLPRAELEVAINEAHVTGVGDPRTLRRALARSAGHHGAGALARAIQDDPGLTRSGGERRLSALVNAAGLPLPILNTRLHGWEVDAVWPDRRVVVELDGWGAHRTRRAFERDRRKDADLQLAGYVVLRITFHELEHRPHAVVARLAAALARATAPHPAAAARAARRP